VGARVHVPSLGAEGRVVSPPDARGRVRVAVGSLSLELDAADLGSPPGKGQPARPASAPAHVRGAGVLPPPTAPDDTLAHARPTPACTLDLRGQRADDVIDAVESFLDRAALDGRSPLFVIHGHGTGALKKIVRDYVLRSAYVRRWSPGGKGQGGDGVTVIEL
jgi:DNA mismatch repair protein MutS2